MLAKEADSLLGKLLNGRLHISECAAVDWRAFQTTEHGLIWRIASSATEMGRPLVPDAVIIHVAKTFSWVTEDTIFRLESELTRLRKVWAVV